MGIIAAILGAVAPEERYLIRIWEEDGRELGQVLTSSEQEAETQVDSHAEQGRKAEIQRVMIQPKSKKYTIELVYKEEGT